MLNFFINCWPLFSCTEVTVKNKTGDEWFPFWVDKWLFGSTRHEFTHAQRAIWADIMVLSKKDGGYIRANIGVAYPIPQLAGFFNCSIKLLTNTIHKAIEVGKLQQMADGTLFVTSTPKYTISERHKRRVELAMMSANPAMMSEKADTSLVNQKHEIREKRREEENNIHPLPPQGDTCAEEFENEFWPNVLNKIGKGKAREAYIAARKKKKIPKEIIIAGLPKYRDYETQRQITCKNDYRPLHPATWLNQERWEDDIKKPMTEYEKLKSKGEI